MLAFLDGSALVFQIETITLGPNAHHLSLVDSVAIPIAVFAPQRFAPKLRPRFIAGLATSEADIRAGRIAWLDTRLC
jgi:hypothetical protein